MNVAQILLVDDDPALLQALSHTVALHIPGIKVDLAPSAFNALERIQRYDYDAVISDIMMPGLDGLELLERLKALRPATPMLLITGQLDPVFLQKAMDAGAYDFIQKPIDRLFLIGALKRAIQTHQMQKQLQQQQSLLKTYATVVGPLAEDAAPSTRSVHPVAQSPTPFQPPKWLL